MSLQWNAKEAIVELKTAAAQRLFAAAVAFQTEHMHRLNVSNPKPHLTPSKPGEYPRKRTGFLQGSVLIEPTDLNLIAREQSVRIGYSASANYGNALSQIRNRKGLLDTLDSMKTQLQRIVEGG